MRSPIKSLVYPYIVATLVISLAILLRWLLHPILQNILIFVTLYGAVAYIAWYSGLKPAVLAALAGYIICNYLFIEPGGTLHFDITQQVGFLAYLFTCSIIIALGESTRHAQARFALKEAERLRIEADLRASEQSMRTILESITDSFITLDKDWRFSYVNPSAEQALGRPAKDLLNKNIWEEFPETKGGEIEALLRKVIKDQNSASVTTYYAPHERWYELRAYPTLDGISVYFRDVTQRRVAEVNLRESEAKRKLALDAAELGAWNLNITNQTLTCDERYRMIRAGSTAPLSYDQALEHIHPEDRDKVLEAIALATNSSASTFYSQEYRVIHVDGSVHWVLAKGKPHFVGEGNQKTLISLDGTVADITEQKRIEQQILRQSAELAQANQRKNEFIATLAHELRNPLAPIRNSLSIMELKGHDVQTVEKARLVIERQVVQMVRLVDDLLDVSRISHGKLELKRQHIALSSVIDSALESSKPMIDAAGLTLTVSAPTEPIYLNADATRLTQVLMNLLNNAAKFTDQGGQVRLIVEQTAKTETGTDDHFAKITVTDTGIGISAEFLPRIFDAFTQLPNSVKRSQGGLGVGLMLVRRLVEMHGGVIVADSPGLGLGTTFTMMLPILNQADLSDEMIAKIVPATNTDQLRILIVDDNVDAANSLGALMEHLDNEITVVHDGTSALQAAPAFNPQVIFLDIGLPDMTGYEVAKKIRKTAWGESVKLYALTGWGQEEDRRKSQEAGFDAHLVKPIDPRKLIDLLASLH